MATPSAVPSSPKVKTGPSLIPHPFSFQGQPLPPWPSSTEALRPQWFQPGEGLSLSWAGSSGPQTGFPTLTRAGTSPHGSLPPTLPCSSSSLHLGMLRGGLSFVSCLSWVWSLLERQSHYVLVTSKQEGGVTWPFTLLAHRDPF